MASGDLYQVKMTWTDGTDNFLNIHHYLALGGTYVATHLLDAFDNLVPGEQVDLLHTSVSLSTIEVVNIFDPTDFDSLSYTSFDGLRSGERLPSFVSLSFRCLRRRTDMRHGWKRVGPLSEGMLTDGYNIISTQVANADAYATAIGTTLQNSGVDSFEPIIVKRIREGLTPETWTYRLPENQLELTYYVADQWRFLHAGSQTSRKRGVGA